MKKTNLICLPFAGGNKYSYRDYERKAPSILNIIPLEYPGRGARIQEPLLSDINALVADLYQQVKGMLDHPSYAIYGHSMGGLIGCLLTREIVLRNHRPPLHLFITGTAGPAAPSRRDTKRHLMEKAEFLEEIKNLNGSPDGVLKSEELLDYFEPILRADFKACESYVYEESGALNVPMTVITGTEEDMEEEEIALWQKESNQTVDFRRMPGGHFFILNYPDSILEIITGKIIRQ
ncbi:thioesterase II family protein [Flavitalea flava]